MIHISVILHSVLQELLPAEVKGRITLEIQLGTTIEAVMQQLHIPVGAAFAINNAIERSKTRELAEGDELRFFRSGAGG